MFTTRQQTKILAEYNSQFQDWKNHWDGNVFKKANVGFEDLRRMADGNLPKELADKLAHPDYAYMSKIVPRIVPDAIQYMKAIASNTLFNRDLVFDFIPGQSDVDAERAQDANDLVTDQFYRTEFRRVAEQLIEDMLEVGICFFDRRHWRDIRPVVKYGTDKKGNRILIRNSFQTIFEGPRIYRRRPEMVYLDPEARDPMEDPEYSLHMILPISQVRHEAAGGILQEYADNVKKIKPEHYDPNVAYEPDQKQTHRNTNKMMKTKDQDFNVLYTEHWRRLPNPETNIPVFTRIGVFNYNTTPLMACYDIDPMLTGKSSLGIGRVYPRNDIMVGESIPGKIRQYLLTKFFTRNTRIDIAQLARDITGLFFVSGGLFDTDSFVTKRKRFVKMRSNLPSEMKDIKLDTSPIVPLMNEEVLVDADIEKTLATNRIAMGQTPLRRETATAIAYVNENSQIMSNYPLRQIEDSLIKPAAVGCLVHSQLLMPEEFKVRILGNKRATYWKDMNREQILGVYDVRCYGSSEILAKAVKQSLIDKFVQTWGNNPHVRIDWQGLAREHMKLSEIPSAERYVPDMSYDIAYAERENGIMMNGGIVPVIEQDNHRVHVMEHLKLKEMAEQTVGRIDEYRQNAPDQLAGEYDRGITILSNIDEHIKKHEMFDQMQQGQINVGAGEQIPTTENMSKVLRNVNSDLNPEPLGG